VHTSWEVKTQFSVLAPPIPVANKCQTVPTIALSKGPAASIPQVGPLHYSPVEIFVLPRPQFIFLPGVLSEEQRFVMQVPAGRTWQLPQVRQAGYRALGSFAKVPLHLPDRYLQVVQPRMHPPTQDMACGRIETQQDLTGLPFLATLTSKRLHPADYWAWPALLGINLVRSLAEYEYQHAGGAVPEGSPKARRFGPGRAGLQIRNRSADGLAKSKGLRQEPYSA
jgi:hypothetical protein